MTTSSAYYWKRLWRWVISYSLTEEELTKVLDKNVIESLLQGLNCYKPYKPELYQQLQTTYPDQTRLLSIVQTLQNYMSQCIHLMLEKRRHQRLNLRFSSLLFIVLRLIEQGNAQNIDCFQIWDILKHYLCDISYGTPESALKNIAFIDTRPSFLLPNTWNFYYSERLFLLKLLLYIIQHKSDINHKYKGTFSKIITNIQIKNLRTSLISQFEKLIIVAPPLRRIQTEFGNENVRQEWAEANLREQRVILQILLVIANEESFPDSDFSRLFSLFRKHNFGKNQSYNELLDERQREICVSILYMELGVVITILDKNKIDNLASWIENTKETVEFELEKLEPNSDCSITLISWMMLSLQCEKYARLFESQYQHYGATALRLRVFEFTLQMLNSKIYSDNSLCSQIVRRRVFHLINEMCDKFDGDGTISQQPGIMQLCAELLRDEGIARYFWSLHQRDENCGAVSLWNTALEYFPYNFSALSTLAGGLAQAGPDSVQNLLAELKSLPVYTEVYNPATAPAVSLRDEDAVVGRDYCPLGSPAYTVPAGSSATVLERKEGTMIHYRTPYSYWTILNNEIEKTLDRRQVYQHLNVILERVYEGTRVLKAVLASLVLDKESVIPKVLVGPSEGVFDVLIRFMRADSPPLLLLLECLGVCTALIPIFPIEIHLRLINTGLLPRLMSRHLTPEQYAAGAALDSAAVGTYLVTVDQTRGTYGFLAAYIDMLCAFYEASDDERITGDVLLPGLMLILREVFPNVSSWRYSQPSERRTLLQRCTKYLTLILEDTKKKKYTAMLKKTCVYSLLHTENALELLKIISIGTEGLEKLIQDESDWESGARYHYTNIQHCIAIVMLVLKEKTQLSGAEQMTPLELLVFAQNKQKDTLRAVPRVTSYINNTFSKSLSVLSCRLLRKFADRFQMSLFASLDMTAYQVRVMFLERLRDENESVELKNAILEFVTTCIGKQPGLTEAFFMMNHENDKIEEKNNEKAVVKKTEDDTFEGILGYMADYLGFVKTDAKFLHSSLLGSIMALFHALWRNNMQILVKKLRQHPKFWEYMTSPLFSELQPGLRTYGQIYNVLGVEMFISRGKLDANLQLMLEQLFDVNNSYLDTWINYVFSFEGRTYEEVVDKVPVWLALLTSWKDFTTISCKCLPISLNIAHKSKMVAPCMSALLTELDQLKDGRLVVILAELYVIMLSNWKDDCFDNRKASAKQIDNLLTNTAIVYEDLHPRALRAILTICTVAISSLDYEIKGNSAVAQSIIRSVTNINSLELEKLLDDIKDDKKADVKQNGRGDVSPMVLSLAMLEQCLELYDDMFSGLSQWFQSTKFINKLLCCLHMCLQNRRHLDTSLAALRCLTAYARGPFSGDLLMNDVDQFLWLQLLPPKFETTTNGNNGTKWKPQEWWRVYSHSLDFITMMLMKHGQFFADTAITFVGVHMEQIVEAVLLPGQAEEAGAGAGADALGVCGAALALVVQLVRFEQRWRTQNIHSLGVVMRSISVSVHQTVSQLLRARRPDPAHLHRLLEILHMSTLCLLAFSPGLLPLLADPALDTERWQPLVELHFGAPKISYEPFPQLTFGTILSAICLLIKSLNHAYHLEEGSLSGVVSGSGGRSPRGRRRACSCGSPGGAVGGTPGGGAGGAERRARGGSAGSTSSAASALPAPSPRLLAAAVHAAATLLAQQALLAIRDAEVPTRHKQLVRRELASELTGYHEFVRRRIVCAAHARPYLLRNKLGIWPLRADEEELRQLEQAQRERNPAADDQRALPPPPPPKRASHDSIREHLLRKHYLDRCAQTPTKELPAPVSHSTPTSDRKKDSPRSSKRVSWAETTRETDENSDCSMQEIDSEYSNLTDVQINNDEDYFHFMSVLFLYVCQTDL